MGTKLPRKLVQKMSIVGEQIKLARLRRNLSVVQIAERATCSPLTVSRIEKGSVVSQRRQIGKSFAGFEFEDKETSFKKGIGRMSSYT